MCFCGVSVVSFVICFVMGSGIFFVIFMLLNLYVFRLVFPLEAENRGFFLGGAEM